MKIGNQVSEDLLSETREMSEPKEIAIYFCNLLRFCCHSLVLQLFIFLDYRCGPLWPLWCRGGGDVLSPGHLRSLLISGSLNFN